MNLMPMNIATRSEARLLREARERLRWSQRALGARLDISAGYVALLEAGAKRASSPLWTKIGRLFAAQAETAALAFQRESAEPSERDSMTDVTGTPTYSSQPEFEVESPFGEEWLATFPFTVIVGAPGSGKTTFLLSRLQEVMRGGQRTVVWVS